MNPINQVIQSKMSRSKHVEKFSRVMEELKYQHEDLYREDVYDADDFYYVERDWRAVRDDYDYDDDRDDRDHRNVYHDRHGVLRYKSDEESV